MASEARRKVTAEDVAQVGASDRTRCFFGGGKWIDSDRKETKNVNIEMCFLKSVEIEISVFVVKSPKCVVVIKS